jgi:subtilisin-like proprotein convertase family protein
MSITKWILLIILVPTAIFGSDKVIYGDDDRLDIYQAAHLPRLTALADSTLSIVDNFFIDTHSDGEFVYLENRIWGESEGMCESERFTDQPYIATCSSFLVGEDIVATAGHCIDRLQGCQKNSFVFNYSYRNADSIPTTIAKSEVYRCKEIIARTLDFGNGADFAIVRLDRPVLNHTPLSIRKTDQITEGAAVAIIGNSYGLPTKISPNGVVRTNHQDTFFTATLDSYAGNSGSAVFDQETGIVEGVLVRGDKDFVSVDGCLASKVCQENECQGEDVVRSTQFAHLIPPRDRQWTINEYNFEMPNLPQDIKDEDEEGLTFTFKVDQPGRVHRLSIYVDFVHEKSDELIILLYDPSGKRSFMMWKYDNFDTEVSKWFGDKSGWYPVSLNLRGYLAQGTWKVHLADYYQGNVGKLRELKVNLKTYK